MNDTMPPKTGNAVLDAIRHGWFVVGVAATTRILVEETGLTAKAVRDELKRLIADGKINKRRYGWGRHSGVHYRPCSE